MTLKEQFIKEFKKSKRYTTGSIFIKKISLFEKNKESEALNNLFIIEKDEFLSIMQIDNGSANGTYLDYFNEEMEFSNENIDLNNYHNRYFLEIIAKVKDICRKIETRNLEKQMLKDTKHTAPAKTKLLKF